jgi:flagellar hook-associated protein 2
MSTVTSGTGSVSSAAAAAAAEAAAQSALQEAGQSLISSSTGNSSLDVQSIVTALVNAKTAGTTAALTAEAQNDNTQISAIGQLQAALSSLQVGLAPLFNGQLQSTFGATLSGTGITASAGTGAVAGTYSIKVTQIAQAQSISSGAFNADQDLGTGNLTISVGGKSMQLAVTSSNDSLSDIASAINSSTSNPGLSATVVSGSDGQHLVLSSNTTGAANTISVNVTNVVGDNGLSSLGITSSAGSPAGSPSTFTSANSSLAWTQSTAAQDAQFTINGTPADSGSNTVTTVLPGVTLNLTAAAIPAAGSTTSATQTLTIAPDTTAEVNDIESFVSDYNAVVSQMSSLSTFSSSGSAGSQGGPLLGDTMLNQIQDTLGNLVSGSVTSGGVTASLSSLGITLNDDGTMSVDSTTLTTAVQSNPTAVGALFNSTNGLAQQLNTSINTFTESGGIMDIRTNALTADLTNVKTQANTLTAYTAQLTSQYNNEFTALNTLMATTNSNSQYLTQLFGGANSAGALASGGSSS